MPPSVFANLTNTSRHWIGPLTPSPLLSLLLSLFVDDRVLESSSGNATLKHDVELSIRSTLAFGQSEVRPSGDEPGGCSLHNQHTFHTRV